MKLEFEYGQGLLGAELPDSTDIFIPGETVADPPCLPQDWDILYAATLSISQQEWNSTQTQCR